jgi:epoxyqueuosine reductase
MHYLESAPRSDPRELLSGAITLAVAAAHYQTAPDNSHRLPLLGQVARYAHGSDYHGSLRRSLASLGQLIADESGRSVTARACVDTAPLLEREAARRAGLGFIGKSNMLIVPGTGSGVLLGVLIVDIEITGANEQSQRCGQCNACLDACPTRAFVGPWELDARRCISYLTIEFKGWIPFELRPLIGTRVFGCDVCQEVCPFNQGKQSRALVPSGTWATSDNLHESLMAWLTLSASGYRRLTANSSLRRTSRAQLLRNAAIAAGNSGVRDFVAPLQRLVDASIYPIVRGHAAWALGELGGDAARAALQAAQAKEPDHAVQQELQAAIRRTTSHLRLLSAGAARST